MRTVHAELAAYLNANSIGTVRHLITLTPRVGSAVRWTDHDLDIAYGGNTYYRGGDGTTCPIPHVTNGTQVAGLEIGVYSVTLDCGSMATINGTFIPSAATARELDGAKVEIVRYFLDAPVTSADNRAMALWTGYIGPVKVSPTSVTLDVESGVSLLNVQIPKVTFQAGCMNMLYDGICSLVKASFTVTGTVSSGATTTVIPTSRTEATGTTNTSGWFALGVISFTSGACNGEERAVRKYELVAGVGTFTLDRPLPVAPSATDAFSVFPGCPKTSTACTNNTAAAGPQFNNTRFRGMPFVPKNEAAL